MPNYRIVAGHGANRIVVRDEKGNETLRRASHLKACDWKQKVSNMVPGQQEYDKFGRSTKLLIHPRDILDLQFDRNTRNKGEISPETEISTIEANTTSVRDEHGKIPPNHKASKVITNLSSDREKSVDHSDLSEKKGRVLAKSSKSYTKSNE